MTKNSFYRNSLKQLGVPPKNQNTKHRINKVGQLKTRRMVSTIVVQSGNLSNEHKQHQL